MTRRRAAPLCALLLAAPFTAPLSARETTPPVLALEPSVDTLRMLPPGTVDMVLVPGPGTACETPGTLPGMPALMLWAMMREITRALPPPAEIRHGASCAEIATAAEAARSLGEVTVAPADATALPAFDGPWRLWVLSPEAARGATGRDIAPGGMVLMNRVTGQAMAEVSMRMRGMN